MPKPTRRIDRPTPPPGWTRAKLRALILAGTCLGTAALPGFAAAGGLDGATVVSGSVGLTRSGTATTIQQGSDRALVDWRSFSVGRGESLTIVQPSQTSILVNRVRGGDATVIDGALTANGQVHILNPNGVLIGAGGRVDVAGLLATTGTLADENFAAGAFVYDKSGTTGASVVNRGLIRIADRGYAALAAGTVENTGLIEARLGRVALAGAETFALDIYGDRLISFAVPGGGRSGDGDEVGRVKVGGAIRAQGGVVAITAKGARDAMAGVINMDGVVEAQSIRESGGRIFIGAGDEEVTLSGRVDASAAADGAKGGTIDVVGSRMTLAGATVAADGPQGGGTIRIGGAWQGGAELPRARTTDIDAATTITADATRSGDGGTVVIWSDDKTTFAGRIAARGGADGGDGGKAEVSGKAFLDYRGFTDLTAAQGRIGDLLLDPYDLEIGNGTSRGMSEAGSTGYSGENSSFLSAAALSSALNGANVTIFTGSGGSQQGNITVTGNVNWSSSSYLVLSAHNNITIASGGSITNSTPSASLSLYAGRDQTGNGTVIVNGTVALTGSSSSIFIDYNPADGASRSTVNGTRFTGANISTVTASAYVGQVTASSVRAYMLVNTVEDLQNMQNTRNGWYKLAGNIDASATSGWNGGLGFLPIAQTGTVFTGRLHGNSKTISNLTINRPGENNVGMIGQLGSNGRYFGFLSIKNWNITGANNTGALAGIANGSQVFSVRASSVSVTGQQYTGGLVGQGTSTTYSDTILNSMTVSGTREVGGVAGIMNSGSMTDVDFLGGSVTGTNTAIGGLTGFTSAPTSITTSSVTGSVNGGTTATNVGGLVGTNNGNITQSNADLGTVQGLSDVGGLVGTNTGSIGTSFQGTGGTASGGTRVGGLVGTNTGNINNSFVYGNTITTDAGGIAGGLVGQNNSGGVNLSYFAGKVTANASSAVLGGLIGTMTGGSIGKSFSIGELAFTAGGTGGGLVGDIPSGYSPSILSSYASGRITSATASGGVVGTVTGTPTFTSVYFDDVTSAANASYGGALTGTTGLSGANARLQGFYSGLDFTNDWFMVDGMTRPLLRWEYSTSIVRPTQLQLMAMNLSASYTLDDDLDFSTISATGLNPLDESGIWGSGGFARIGSASVPFTGTFNGNGRSIKNLTINRPSLSNVGVFGSLSGGSITNLVIEGGSFTGLNNVSSVVGLLASGTVNGVRSTATVSGTSFVGGIVGRADGGSLLNAIMGSTKALRTVTASADNVGGIVGYLGSATLNNVEALNLSVSTTGSYAGGIAGRSVGGTITNALSNTAGSGVQVNAGTDFAGGLVGEQSGGATIANSLAAAGAATTTGTNRGAFIGANNGTISGSYFDSVAGGLAVGAGSGSSAGLTGLTTAQITTGDFSNMPALSAAWHSIGSPRPSSLYYVVRGTQYDQSGVGVNTYPIVARTTESDLAIATASLAPNGSFALEIPKVGYYPDNFIMLKADGAIGGDTGNTIMPLASRSDAHVYLGYLNVLEDTPSIGTIGGLQGLFESGNSLAFDPTGTFNLFANVGLRGTFTNFAIEEAIVLPRPLVITATGNVTQSASINAPGLLMQGTNGNYRLTDTGNQISGNIAANTGTVDLANLSNTVIGALFGVNGVSTTSKLRITTNSNLTINPGMSVSAVGTGDALVLAAAGNFTNNAGSGAVSISGGGRWLIFSTDPGSSSPGGLPGLPLYNQPFTFSTRTYGSFTNTGNRLVYSAARTLTVTPDSVSVQYVGTTPVLTFTYSGLAGSDTLAQAVSGTPGSTGLGVNAGTYTVTASLGSLVSDLGYGFSFGSGTVTINPRTLTVTANNLTRVYGDADPTFTYTATGLLGGDTLTGALARSAGNDVGSYAIGQGTLAAGSNYTLTFVGGTLTITPRPVTVLANSVSRVYGDTDAPLTYAATGLIGGDTLTGALSRATGNGVGSYAINQGTLAAGSNYILNFSGGTLTITPRTVSVVADARTRVYGEADPALTYTASGLIGGDTLTGSLSRAAGNGVGSYAITQGSLANPNYVVAFTGNTLTITPRALTVTADSFSRVYGDADPTLTYTATGLLAGDTLSGALTRAAGSNVGSYAIGLGTLNNPNYTISFAGGTLTITPRPLTIAANAQSRIYGDPDGQLTYTTTGLVAGDALTGSLARAAGTDVGTYAITQGTLSAGGNYAVTFTGNTFTITPRALSIVVDAQRRVYGDPDAPLTYRTVGLVAGDSLTGSLTRAAGANVGTYAITQGTLSASRNYTVTFTGNTLTITPRPLTVTANSFSRVYGDADPTLTYSASGLVAGDALSGSLTRAAGNGVGSYAITQGSLSAGQNYTLTFNGGTLTITPRTVSVVADARTRVYGEADPALTYTASGLIGGDTLTGSLSRVAGNGVGSYAITQGSLANPNYVVAFTGNTLTITPRALTVTANSFSRVYGDADPTLTYTATGLLAGDTLSGALTRAAGSNVGSYAIGLGTLNNPNYTISFAGGTLTITPRPLTIAANAQSRIYGDPDGQLTYTTTGLVAGDALTGSLARATGTDVGTYAITQGTLSAGGNYTVTFTGNTLTITPRALTVRIGNAQREYGLANPTFTFTVAGLVAGDTESVLAGMTLSTAATTGSPVGRYDIVANGAAPRNYAVTTVNGTLTIIPASLLVRVNDASRTSSQPNPTFTVTLTGLRNGDLPSVLTGVSLTTTATATSPNGTYAITASGGTAPNYTLSYQDGTLTITTPAAVISQVASPNTITQITTPTVTTVPVATAAASPVLALPSVETRTTTTTATTTTSTTSTATASTSTTASSGTQSSGSGSGSSSGASSGSQGGSGSSDTTSGGSAGGSSGSGSTASGTTTTAQSTSGGTTTAGTTAARPASAAPAEPATPVAAAIDRAAESVASATAPTPSASGARAEQESQPSPVIPGLVVQLPARPQPQTTTARPAATFPNLGKVW